jgi:hypothetical protein
MPIGRGRQERARNMVVAPPPRRAAAPSRPSWSDQVRVLAQTVVQHITGIEPANRELTPVVWSRWMTAGDEKVCPVCGPYAGRAWPLGEGPNPPLHANCRCSREYAFTTWQARPE